MNGRRRRCGGQVDPITLAVLAGVVFSVVVVAIGASVAWWLLRKTLTMRKRLVLVGLALVLVAAAVGAGVAVLLLQ